MYIHIHIHTVEYYSTIKNKALVLTKSASAKNLKLILIVALFICLFTHFYPFITHLYLTKVQTTEIPSQKRNLDNFQCELQKLK